MTRPRRLLWLLFLFGGLAFLAAPAVSRAQEPAPVEGEGGGSSGDPLYGYLGTAALAGGAIFILCKSARRN